MRLKPGQEVKKCLEDFVHENGTIDLAALSNPEGLSVLGIFIDIADNSTSPLYTAWFDVGRFSNI